MPLAADCSSGGAEQEMKGFGWINRSSNTFVVQHTMIPSVFGEENIVFLNRVVWLQKRE